MSTENEAWLARRESERAESWSQRMDGMVARLRAEEDRASRAEAEMTRLQREALVDMRERQRREMAGSTTVRELGKALRTIEHLRNHIANMPHRVHTYRRSLAFVKRICDRRRDIERDLRSRLARAQRERMELIAWAVLELLVLVALVCGGMP